MSTVPGRILTSTDLLLLVLSSVGVLCVLASTCFSTELSTTRLMSAALAVTILGGVETAILLQ